MITMTAVVMITSQMIRTMSQAELMKDFSSPEAGSTFVIFPLSPDFPGRPGGPGRPLGPGGPPGPPGIPAGPLGPGSPTGPCKKKETLNILFSPKDTLNESRGHHDTELQGGLTTAVTAHHLMFSKIEYLIPTEGSDGSERVFDTYRRSCGPGRVFSTYRRPDGPKRVFNAYSRSSRWTRKSA